MNDRVLRNKGYTIPDNAYVRYWAKADIRKQHKLMKIEACSTA